MGSLGRSAAVVLSLCLHLVSESSGFVLTVQDNPLADTGRTFRDNGEPVGNSVPPGSDDLILDEITISDRNSGSVNAGGVPVNGKTLALIVNKAELEKQLSNSETDQDPAASEPIFLNLQEFGDTENLEDVLAVAGYEPQKIESKSKRKVTRASNDYPGHQIRAVPAPSPASNQRVNTIVPYPVYFNPVQTATTIYPVQPISTERLLVIPPSAQYPIASATQNLNVAQTAFLTNPTEGTKFGDSQLKETAEPTVAHYVGLTERTTKSRNPTQLTPTTSSIQYAEPTKRRKVKARGRLQEQGTSSNRNVGTLASTLLPVQETADTGDNRQNNFGFISKYNVVPRPFSLPPAAEATYEPANTMAYPSKTSPSAALNTERTSAADYMVRRASYDGALNNPSHYAAAEPVPVTKEIPAHAAVESYDSVKRSPVKNPSAENGRRFDNADEQTVESVESVEILRVKEKQRPLRPNDHNRENARGEKINHAAQSRSGQYKISETPEESYDRRDGQDQGYDGSYGKHSKYEDESAEGSDSEKYSENYKADRDRGKDEDDQYEPDQGHFVDHGAYQGTGEDHEHYHDDRVSDGDHDESGASGGHEGQAEHVDEEQDGAHDHGNYQQVDHEGPGGFGYEHIEQLRHKYRGLGQDHGDYRRQDQGQKEAVEGLADQKDAASGGGKEGGSGGGGHGGGGGGGGGNYKYEKGAGGEAEEKHHASHGQHGDKGYKSWHENDKAKKGHHNKEHHSKHYDEEEGGKKDHEDEGGYHQEHHAGEEGEKGAKFSEKGEHNKGHSTKGEHFVHKKDEYEKKTEFFDEFHEGGDSEKEGEYHHEHEQKKGGHKKVGHYEKKDHDEKYGKESKYAKGGHHHDGKGHKVSEGQEHHYDHGSKHGKKGAEHDGKKWMYKKGSGGGGGGSGGGGGGGGSSGGDKGH